MILYDMIWCHTAYYYHIYIYMISHVCLPIHILRTHISQFDDSHEMVWFLMVPTWWPAISLSLSLSLSLSYIYIYMYTYIYTYIYIYMHTYIHILSSSRKPSGLSFYGFRRRHRPTFLLWFPSLVFVYGFRRGRERFLWFPSLVFVLWFPRCGKTFFNGFRSCSSKRGLSAQRVGCHRFATSSRLRSGRIGAQWQWHRHAQPSGQGS